MPTNTFFRLPEEKRQRLIDAAWEEFSQMRFNDVSINRIIQNAHIPRGSFYQYFVDKDDLFLYLLEEGKSYITAILNSVLRETGGNLFTFPLQVFDRLFQQGRNPEAVLGRWIQLIRMNPALDCQKLFDGRPGQMPEETQRLMDTSVLKEQSQAYVDVVVFMLFSTLAPAVVETLRDTEQREVQRRILRQKVEIIQYGCLDQSGGQICME